MSGPPEGTGVIYGLGIQTRDTEQPQIDPPACLPRRPLLLFIQDEVRN